MANPETPAVDENKIIAERRAKLAALREKGTLTRIPSVVTTSPVICTSNTMP